MGGSRLAVQLLGLPSIERDGRRAAPPRGHKAWGLLAYLLLTERPPSRDRLAALLFPDADDPLAALRWALSELRRTLGPELAVDGNPVRLVLAPWVFVDVHVLARAVWTEAASLPGLELELLEGIDPSGSAAFELWLAGERRRMRGVAASVLREAAHASLARGDEGAAVGFATRLVRLEPLDENHHALLVRALCRAGRGDDAAEHVGRATTLLERELGISPSPALRRALVVEAAGRPVGAAVIRARIERGEAAVAAGALEEGLRILREAAAAARDAREHRLLAGALVSLGEALVHAARGGDEEGTAVLHEAVVLAAEIHDDVLGATARRMLAWVELYRGRYDRLLPLLDEAVGLAGDDEVEVAWLEMIRGAALTEMGQYTATEEVVRTALGRAELLDLRDAGGLAWALLGRIQLLRRELTPARRSLERSLDRTRAAGWVAFLPLPEAFLAEVELLEGAVDRAASLFEHAFALGHEVDDPCWESIATRGLGLVAAARGDTADALRLLVEAPAMCRRLPDSSRWIEAYALDALCSFAVGQAVPGCARWVTELEDVATSTGMRELVARAASHRAHLAGEPALDAATLLVEGVDNPALGEVVGAGSASWSRMPGPD